MHTESHPVSRPSAPIEPGDLVDQAVEMVAEWARRSEASETDQDRSESGALSELLDDPAAVAFTMGFVDRVARPDDHRAAAHQLQNLVNSAPLPAFLSPVDRLLLKLGARVAPILPFLVMPLAQRRMRGLVGHLIVDSDPGQLARHIGARRSEGNGLNVNLLGEAVLGDTEADRRLNETMDLVSRSEVDYVSVKVSSVAAQLHPWAFNENRDRIVARLHPLFAAAEASTPPTFLNLDMEEYRDLELTIAAFITLLDSDEFSSVTAGIVLQAYLPDSFLALQRLVDWSTARKASGGGEIKIRLVKGANLAMEKVEADLRGWEQAPYRSKAETDANFKRCLDWVLTPGRTEAVRIGVASHNLFDLAWTHLLSEARTVADRVTFEMLQGMAPAQSRVVRSDTGAMLLYTPAVAPAHFDVAISYLFRRLEENATPDNFMYSVFGLTAGSENFAREEDRFRVAVADRWSVDTGPNRDQDRSEEVVRTDLGQPFFNEADTDPALAANRAWGLDLVRPAPAEVERARTTTVEEVDSLVEAAAAAGVGWAAKAGNERRAILRRAADELAARRGDLVSAMVNEANKTIGEADPEVSEAIDFARYYADRAAELGPIDGAGFVPLGVVTVVPPWNFPVAIPAGGVLAALAAGNAVLFKPAPATPRCAEIVAEALWSAGVPADVLHLVVCEDNEVGRRLVTHPSVAGVILTGSIETARLFRSWKPDINLYGETSGKNSLIITPNADIDLAVADLVHSAFGHSGQKCSAASLAVCVGSVYRSERFRRQLADAVRTLEVGPSTEIGTTMGPLIGPADGKLLRALTQLDEGEEWLVEPRQLDDVGEIWTPGVRLGVSPGSWFHQTECFGPVLGLIEAADLDEAIDIQNGTEFGLTGGIHTLEPAEADYWLDRVEVGNAYVNRPITGAIVRRQSFGGWKGSAIGPGAKAGGPNYVLRLGHWVDQEPLSDAEWLEAAADSDKHWWLTEFSRERDESGLFSEANLFRYRPLSRIVIRVSADGTEREVTRCLAAAATCGVDVVLSRSREESEAQLAQRLGSSGVDRVRFVGTVEDQSAFHEAEIEVISAPVVASGRLELTYYLHEQAISRTLHRFGNLI